MKSSKLFLMVCVTALTACQHDLDILPEEEAPVAISLNTVVGDAVAETRFASSEDKNTNLYLQNNQFLPASTATVGGVSLTPVTGNSIAVYIEDQGTGTPKTTYTKALKYTPDGNGGLSVPNTETQYYPSNNGGVGIYAYYPGQSTDLVPAAAADVRDRNTDLIAFSVQEDQTTLDNYAKSDLMYAKLDPQPRTKDSVTLTFNHLLTKITLVIKSDGHFQTDHLKDADVTIENTKLKANFNFKDGEIKISSTGNYTYNSTDNTAKPITILKDLVQATVDSSTGQTGSCIIVPQKVAAGAEFIKVKLTNGGTYIFKAPTGGYTFEPKKEYKFTVTLTNTEIKLVSEIIEWGTGATYTDPKAMMPAQE